MTYKIIKVTINIILYIEQYILFTCEGRVSMVPVCSKVENRVMSIWIG